MKKTVSLKINKLTSKNTEKHASSHSSKHINKLTSKRTNKLTSLVLSASILLGTAIMPTKTNCDFNASVLIALRKTPEVMGRFFTSKFGVKAIASCLFITQNIVQFCQDKNINKDNTQANLEKKDDKSETSEKSEKSGENSKNNTEKDAKEKKSKLLTFRIGQAGALLAGASDNKTFDTCSSALNLVYGKDVYGKVWDWADKKVTSACNYCCEKVGFLGDIKQKWDTLKNWWNQDGYVKNFTSKLQNLSTAKLWQFFTSSHGVKTIAQLMNITASGISFYNQDNNIESGLTKTLPFYIGNSAGLISKLASSKVYDSGKAILKLALGEKTTKKIKGYLAPLPAPIADPIF